MSKGLVVLNLQERIARSGVPYKSSAAHFRNATHKQTCSSPSAHPSRSHFREAGEDNENNLTSYMTRAQAEN